MASLRVHDLSVARGDRALFSGLSFDLAGGEILHLRGPNGAGKTSLLEVLCGLRHAAAGAIERPPEPEELHWIGHRNGLTLALTPVENLRFWCGVHGVDAARVAPALERLGVPSRVRQRPCRTLSAGQKRRTALARLVMVRRPFWFLDEPLDGLDAAGLNVFAELLREHAAGAGAAVITSHQALPGGLERVRELVLE